MAMRRRTFIAALGGAAAWPLVARAQQGDRLRRVALIFALTDEDLEYQARLGAVVQGLHDLGWIEGRNVTLDIHRPTASPDDIRKNVAEVLAGKPDVIVTTGTRRWDHCCKRLAPCRSFSHPLSIRSAAGLSKAWPSREEMQRALCSSNTA
jgi:hypothetical protein